MQESEKEYLNRGTGQRLFFYDTTLTSPLRIRSIFRSNSKIPPLHYHPHQEEYFEVVEGEVTLNVDGKVYNLSTGEHIAIMAGQVHAMWNPNKVRAVVNWTVDPPLGSMGFLKRMTALSRPEGEKRTLTDTFKMIKLMVVYHREIRVTGMMALFVKSCYIIGLPFRHLHMFLTKFFSARRVTTSSNI